ncbi:MAG: HD domain-containing protein [Candidatus Moranbacteria bacterium]|nr:HD domain-containing protein [Candidatus Moranbacteria bacterium]NTW89337.1 HD domain-containing protein [Candidatus Moranbacteria bacterium]
MTKKQLLEAIEIEAKKYFVDASGCHDWTHVERVRALAGRIGKAEDADLHVLAAAALLHDVSRGEEMRKGGGFCHAEHGAEEARNILVRLGCEPDFIDRVTHCIRTHRKRGKNIPESLEAKILFDADKLDSLGAIGVGRAFLFAGMAGSKTLYTGNEKELAKHDKDYSYTNEDSVFLEYEKHLKHLKDRLLTKTGKTIARERSDFMKDFFTQFWKEVEGKC